MNQTPASHSRRFSFLAALFFSTVLGWPVSGVAADSPVVAASVSPGAPATAAVPPSTGASTDASAAIENSVVQIFTTVSYPDMNKPWSKEAPQEISGSGIVIEGHRILTNAHMVHYGKRIQVQANGGGDKITATVVAEAPGIDLAILKLDDDSFFDTHAPLPRATKLPESKDTVVVYGFPRGGTNIATTKGIVSRIEFAPYNDFTSGLRIQIDAAINPGNSGGPAVSGNQMIGVAFSRLSGGDNIGYIIPCEEVELFLTSIKDGKYSGKPMLFDELQTLENPALRPYLTIDKSVHGIIVNDPFSSDPSYPLKKWDIITKIGDVPVDDQGRITQGPNVLHFQYLIQKLAHDGKVPLTVVREGKEVQVDVPVSTTRPMLIPPLGEQYPSYYIFGSMVFSNATQDFIESLGGRVIGSLGYIGSPLITRFGDKPAFPGEQLVVVSAPFFPHDLNNGYEQDPTSWVVKSVNGIRIKNLPQLVQVLNDSTDEFLKFEFDGLGLETFVFPRKAMKDSTAGILSDNGISAQGSPDVMAPDKTTTAK